jgi:hypothetical protein
MEHAWGLMTHVEGASADVKEEGSSETEG